MNNSSGHWDCRTGGPPIRPGACGAATGDEADPAAQSADALRGATVRGRGAPPGRGLRDIQYIKKGIGREEDALASGEADITMLFGPPMGLRVDAGDPVVFLAGVHIGCVEIFASERVRTIRDLKGKTFAIAGSRDATYILIATMAAHVGLNPETDIIWPIHPFGAWPQLLAEGKVDRSEEHTSELQSPCNLVC